VFINNRVEPEGAILNIISEIGKRNQSYNYETSKYWKNMLMHKPEV
jgi:hypothetical protein